jgi:NIPSNAP
LGGWASLLSIVIIAPFAKMPAVTRRTLLESLSSVPLLSAALFTAAQRADPKQAATSVYELRVYHAAPGKLGELLARFREHTAKLFEKHGMKNIAYWTPVDEPERGNMLVYILQHPSREAAAANWKSFQDDPEWKRVKEESEANGKLAEKIESTLLALTDFSPSLQ